MKKLFFKIMLLTLIMVTSICVVACDGCGAKDGTVTISKESVKLEIGATVTLTATTDNGEEITWQSSNETVATVTDGVVTALSVGATEISAIAGEISAKCVVTVVEAAQKEGVMVKLDKTQLTLNFGTNNVGILTPTVTKAGLTLSDITVSWLSSDQTVATVDGGIVTAKKIGKADVIARVELDGEWAEAKCTVSVNGEVVLDFNADENTYFVGTDFTLNPTVTVSGEPLTEPISYSIADQNVLNLKENGQFRPVASGVTTVYATVAGETFELDVKIYHKKQINNVQDLTKIDGASEFDYFDLNANLYLNDTSIDKAIISEFSGVLNGNGYKVTVTRNVAPADSTDNSLNGYSVLFGTVNGSAVIKNTQFDITYKAMQTRVDGVACSRTSGFAKNFNGTLENCYVKNTINGVYENTSVMYNFGGKIIDSIFDVNCKHIIGWEVAESKSSMDGVMIVYRAFNRIGKISGAYLSVTNASKYTSIANLIAGTGHQITVGTGYVDQAITSNPQYTNVFGNAWAFDTAKGIVAINGKDISGALKATYSDGNITWADVNATQTEIYIDDVKKTVSVSNRSFAVADYLLNNGYDMSEPHKVEIKATDGTYAYAEILNVKVTEIANESQFRSINGAGKNDYFVLKANITIDDTAIDGAIISDFGGILNGNGYKVTVTRNVAPADSTDNSLNGYSVLFGTVNGSAIIKNTQFDITYKAMQTRVDGSACSRTSGLAKIFNGTLENCYVKNTINGIYENTSVMYNFGGKIIDSIFDVNCKHIIGWEVANSENSMDGVMIVCNSTFARVGIINNSYYKITNVSKYTSMANLIAGTGYIITSDGSTVSNTAITSNPQYTNVFGSAWAFTGTTVSLCGKNVG